MLAAGSLEVRTVRLPSVLEAKDPTKELEVADVLADDRGPREMIRLPSATPLLRCEHQLYHLPVELVVAEKKFCLRHARACLLEAAGLLEHAVPRC